MAKFLPGVPVAKGTRGWFVYSSGSAGINPHALTTREEYTVPAGKRLRVDHANLEIVIAVAATTPKGRQLSLYAVIEGVLTNISKNILRENVNTVGQSLVMNIQPNVFLEEGETLRLYTSDDSSGGKAAYYGHVWYTLFD
ncbi:MAG: hypothetical protein SCH70_07820 [Candidatus Methanoperedens sp.]|nr:hypothetical protein [Candidatus Methanoperedens sp.]